VVTHEGTPPSVETLNQLLTPDGYAFAETPFTPAWRAYLGELLRALLVAGVLIAAFLALGRTGLSGLVDVSTGSSLPMLFVFGVLAGLSSCAALVGGMVLSLARQWLAAYPANASFAQKAEPHLLFNAGRLVSYALFGAALGAVGGLVQISEAVSAILVLIVAAFMLIMGLQMLGIPPFNRVQLALPRFITRRISDERRFQGRVMPFFLGALTFFLPCGFTITAQSLALVSGSAVRGGLIMLFFALGTLPMLLVIGLSSMRLLQTRTIAPLFAKVAGVLVIFFAVWTINARLTVMGLAPVAPVQAKAPVAAVTRAAPTQVAPATPTAVAVAQQLPATPTPLASRATATPVPAPASSGDLPPIVDGKQVVRMTASASAYEPRAFKVRMGVPVRLEVTDVGTSGCTSAMVFPGMFSGRLALTHGQTSVKEFTPQKVGTFKYSCWMGMVTGSIQVVE
jgi:uncharacterized protein